MAESFKSIRVGCESHTEALNQYAHQWADHYSLQNASASMRGSRVMEATWTTYHSTGASFRTTDIALMLLGFFSVTDKQQVVSYTTYHPMESGDASSGRARLVFGMLLEALAILIGIAGLALLVIGIFSTIASNGENLMLDLMLIAGAVACLLTARILLRTCRVARIPSDIKKDRDSPFYLTRIRTMSITTGQ